MGLPDELRVSTKKIKSLFGFPDTFLGEHIARAYHALALNEMRKDFVCHGMGFVYYILLTFGNRIVQSSIKPRKEGRRGRF